MNGLKCSKAVLNLKFKVKIIALILVVAFIFIATINSAINSALAQAKLDAQNQTITDTSYNTAIEAYREAVNAYCKQYSITEYEDIIMKMLSVYSSTHTTDILNSSFSYLNTLYEHKNEGITNPDYSICIGIRQLSEWVKYITENYKSKPIENNNHLFILLQSYELQDKSYIDYAFSKNAYSASDTVDYCSSSSFKSEKNISNIDFNFASSVLNLNILSYPDTNEPKNEQQKRIVELALDYNNYAKNGIKTKGGGCLAFTNDILSAAGLSIKRADCARCAGDYFGVSNDWGSIPIGAEVYGLASQQYGHVGIYIGGGYVVHCTTYKSSDATLLKTVPGGYVVKQSLPNFISAYKAKCWGFSGAWSDKYPYQPGKYMTGLH